MTQSEKYRVLRKLDLGGMAEVFLGESESLEGFKKQVAIKRVLPHLVQNGKFLAMFLDEARLSLSFSNANVVQTFDIGRSGETYFVVMEYVDGTNLKRINEHLREGNEIIPVELAVFIVIEVCRGLSYAHELNDADGQPLGIVHRDVSPPNILLSKQGEVKIVDFGLAKATSQLERTDPGVVKGKFAYLSPEVVKGKEVDLRADIFACGIILFETLTSKRLFLGENDIKTVELVRQAVVPSLSEINPQIPPNLEAIVRKTLAPRPEDRYQSCDELAEALAGFLFEYGRKVTFFDLQRLVKRIAAEDERTAVAKPSIIDQLIQEEVIRFSSLEGDQSGSINSGSNRPSSGAAPLDPTGFSNRERLSAEYNGQYDTPLALQTRIDKEPELKQGRGRTSSSGIGIPDSSSAGTSSEDGFSNPALAQMLEGEIRMGSVPPEKETQNTILWVAIVVATIAAVGSAITAYVLGWIP